MDKQYFILYSGEDNAGVCKKTIIRDNTYLSVYLTKRFPGAKYVNIFNGEDKVSLGRMTKNKSLFKIDPEQIITSIVVCDEQGKVLIHTEHFKDTENPKSEEQTPRFDNFFGGGFLWKRISGNYMTHNYSILHHIFTNKYVYSAINTTGYYCIGEKNEGSLKMIALAVPAGKKVQNPFTELNTDSYIIEEGTRNYYAICIGIDNTGEFFLIK